MSFTPEQAREMAERTERNRKVKIAPKPTQDICCVCGQPVTDGVRITNTVLSRVRHVGCESAKIGSRDSAPLLNLKSKSELYKLGYDAALESKPNSKEKIATSHNKDCQLGDNWKDCPACLPRCYRPTPHETNHSPLARALAGTYEVAKQESGSVRLVLDFWASEGVPTPFTEFPFHPTRKWRFDFCWPHVLSNCIGGVYLEVQGALFGTGKPCPLCKQRKAGRHIRGPALLNEHKKINAATELNWRPLFCIPSELLTVKLTQTIKRALGI